MVMAKKKKGRPSRFRLPKSASEEQVLAEEAVPSSTKYKNKRALKLFREWQQQREMKVTILDQLVNTMGKDPLASFIRQNHR